MPVAENGERPSSAQQQLLEELRHLHAQAGKPGMRRIANKSGYGQAAVSSVFTSNNVPKLPVLRAIVKRLVSFCDWLHEDAEVARFHALWEAALSEEVQRAESPRWQGR